VSDKLLTNCAGDKLLTNCAGDKLLQSCPPTELPDGCYSIISPCQYCENDWGEPGKTKKTPLEWNLSLSVSNLGACVKALGQAGVGYYYASLPAASVSGYLIQNGSCEWIRSQQPWPDYLTPMWSLTSLCLESPSCSDCHDPSYFGLESPFPIFASPILRRISATQFTLAVEFTNRGDNTNPSAPMPWLSCELMTINADNCRSTMSGTTNIRNAGPGNPVLGTLSATLSVKCP
jgi:hypothetical protein